MEAVTFIIEDQDNNLLSGVTVAIYDSAGVLVTTGTSNVDGEVDFLLPSGADPGILYYARFYKAQTAFDNKYGFFVADGEINTFTIFAETISLFPSLNPNWCHIQGNVIYPDNSIAPLKLKIRVDDDVGALDSTLVSPSKEITSVLGAMNFELVRNSWVSVSGSTLPEPKFCHVKDAPSMALLDFLHPIVASIIAEDHDANFSIGESRETVLTATRTDGAGIPADPDVDFITLEEYVTFKVTDEAIATASWSESGILITGVSNGNTTVTFKHREDRLHGPLLRLPYDNTVLLTLTVTVG